MTSSVRSAAVAVVLLFPMVASAHGFGWWRSRTTAAYYYSPPVSYAPIYPVVVPEPYPAVAVPPMPVPQPGTMPGLPSQYAAPSSAPPSAGPACPPPLTSPPVSPGPSAPPPATMNPAPPAVSESRESKFVSTSFYDASSALRSTPAASPTDQGTVSFWNLSARDVTLRVEGQTHTLLRGQRLKLTVPRQFVWKADADDPQTERLPEGVSSLEIVIRR